MREPLEHSGGLRLSPEPSDKFWLDHPPGPSLLLSEAELRWLVTTAGPAVLPRREPVR